MFVSMFTALSHKKPIFKHFKLLTLTFSLSYLFILLFIFQSVTGTVAMAIIHEEIQKNRNKRKNIRGGNASSWHQNMENY